MAFTRFASLLLGINVGGNRKVPMADLKVMLEKMGYENVKTLLASGNVLFDAPGTAASVSKAMEEALEKKFGFSVGVITWKVDDLKKLADTNPFKGIKVTPATRLYVTFLSEKPKSTLKIPYTSDDKSFKILAVKDDVVISVLTVSEGAGTVDAMKILTKEFGKKITTRNWNTVEKLLK